MAVGNIHNPIGSFNPRNLNVNEEIKKFDGSVICFQERHLRGFRLACFQSGVSHCV